MCKNSCETILKKQLRGKKKKQHIQNNELDSKERLEDFFTSHELPKYKATQVIEALYRKQVTSFDLASNLGKKTIELLNNNFTIGELSANIAIHTEAQSAFINASDPNEYVNEHMTSH